MVRAQSLPAGSTGPAAESGTEPWAAPGYAELLRPLAALLCVYGYSLMVYIPMGVACLVPMETVRWAAFLPSMVISSTFLFFNVRGVVAESPKGLAFTTPFMGCVVGAHAVFGLLLKVYWVS